MPVPQGSRFAAVLRACAGVLAAILAGSPALPAAAPPAADASLVVAAVDDTQLVTLNGSVHPLAQPRFDAGPVPPRLPMTELELVLRRSPAQASTLEQLIADQQNRNSPRYHDWLTPDQFGARFGASAGDLKAAAGWLESRGFTIGTAPAGRGRLPFSGTAAQVEAAFHTEIHFFDVDGRRHYANVSKPEIPAALSPLIIGVRGLHDFRPKALLRSRAAGRPRPNYVNSGYDYVGPADFATIYNLNPLYHEQILGTGVSIAIASQSDVDTATPPAYWAAFGVTVAHSVTYLTPYGDPGITGDEIEADLDLEIAGGLAPNAQLIMVTSTDAVSSAAYAINQNLAAIVSISYGNCEYELGTAGNAAINSDYEEAAAQGITVIVASGDQGSAGCDASATSSVYGLGVNGLASTPYDVAVGGTDFNPVLVQEGTYWSSSNAAGTLETALSYIPEMVWNSGCTNPVTIAEDSPGDLDPIAFCNNSSYSSLVTVSAGGGGVSSSSLSQGSNLVGYPQPEWQAGVAGIQAFGARALPDLSLQATDWVICAGLSTSCKPASGGVSFVGGTSAAAPAFAAIVALLDQSQITAGNADGRQGLINPLLYQMAADEYGSAADPDSANLSACNSSQGNAVGTSCIFYDITVGNNSVPCNAKSFVGQPGGTTAAAVCATDSSGDVYGVLELNSKLAYVSGAGYDLATGLGSLNAANLVLAVLGAPSGLTAVLQNGTASLTWNAEPAAPQGSTYNVYEGKASGAEGATPIQTGITGTSATVTSLTATGQTYYFRVAAVAGGKVSYPSNEAAVANPPGAASGVMAVASGTGFTVSWNASFGASSYSIYFGTSAGGEGSTPDPAGIVGTSQIFSGAGGATYYLTVAAVNRGGSSPRSSEVSVMMTPAAPSGVYAATPSAVAVVLHWSACYGAQTYSVYQGTSSGGESATAVETGIAATSTLITGLTPGQKYFFTLEATNAAGTSVASEEAATQMAATSPTTASQSNLFESVGVDSGSLSAGSLESGAVIPQPVPEDPALSHTAATGPIDPHGGNLVAAAIDAGEASAHPSRASAASSATESSGPAMNGGGAVGLVELLLGSLLVVLRGHRRLHPAASSLKYHSTKRRAYGSCSEYGPGTKKRELTPA